MANENMGKLWNPGEDIYLRVAIQSGESLAQMCDHLRRTPYGVVTRLQQLHMLVSIGRDFYRVFPEPWELATNVYALQYPNGKPKKSATK